MEIEHEIVYEQHVVKDDIPTLSHTNKTRIRNAIELKLTTHPELFGKPLRQSLKGYRKLRVSDYRVVFKIEGSFVKVLAILHRSVVYTQSEKRIKGDTL
jgi:mRNA interferase RelE/StbE